MAGVTGRGGEFVDPSRPASAGGTLDAEAFDGEEAAATGLGRTDGRSNALTVILPLKWWGRWVLPLWYFAIGLRPERSFRGLHELRFVSAIRWSILPPFDPGPRWIVRRDGRRHLALVPPAGRRHQLLFESNFDGDWDEYLDTFAAKLSLPLTTMVAAGLGYPGLSTPALFKAYARAHDHIPEAYGSAYPGLTSSDIRDELAATAAVPDERARAHGLGRRAPHWTTLLLPLRPGHSGHAATRARRLRADPTPGAPDPLVGATGIHFARVVVLAHPGRRHLLITLTHDHDARTTLLELLGTDAHRADGGWHDLLACVDGVPSAPGWWDDDTLVDALLAHRPTPPRRQVAYCGYAGTTVAMIRAFEGARFERWPDHGEHG